MRDKGNIRDIKLLQLFLVIFHIDDSLDGLTEDIHGLYLAVLSVRRRQLVALARHALIKIRIRIRLIFQAAHQPSAGSGNLRRIKRQVLLLRHLDGNRRELRKIRVAAERASADPHAAQDFRLVPDSDLTKLDPCLKNAGQIFYQLAKIDPSVRRKVKEHLAVVKCIFRPDELHVQLALRDFFLADAIGFLLLPEVFIFPGSVIFIGHAHNTLQRLRNLFILNLHRAHDDGSVFNAPRRFHDDVVVIMDIEAPRIKIIYLACISEFYAYNFSHLNSP